MINNTFKKAFVPENMKKEAVAVTNNFSKQNCCAGGLEFKSAG